MGETMIAKNPAALQDIMATWHDGQKTTGFVPTMGALHDGHISLVRIARERADRVVVSIFVNPTQFAPHEDFESYPRDTEADLQRLQDLDVDLIYLPRERDIYPGGPEASVQAGPAAHGLEGDFRPHFFDGVVTVVRELFDHVRPDLAVFGEKDFQQLQVIREMVMRLDLGIEIIGAPIIRDAHGLALSSRNAYLNDEALETARYLNKILRALAAEIRDYPDETDDLIPAGMQSLLEAGFDEVDYLELRWNRLLAAAWVGKTRLIDNVGV